MTKPAPVAKFVPLPEKVTGPSGAAPPPKAVVVVLPMVKGGVIVTAVLVPEVVALA